MSAAEADLHVVHELRWGGIALWEGGLQHYSSGVEPASKIHASSWRSVTAAVVDSSFEGSALVLKQSAGSASQLAKLQLTGSHRSVRWGPVGFKGAHKHGVTITVPRSKMRHFLWSESREEMAELRKMVAHILEESDAAAVAATAETKARVRSTVGRVGKVAKAGTAFASPSRLQASKGPGAGAAAAAEPALKPGTSMPSGEARAKNSPRPTTARGKASAARRATSPEPVRGNGTSGSRKEKARPVSAPAPKVAAPAAPATSPRVADGLGADGHESHNEAQRRVNAKKVKQQSEELAIEEYRGQLFALAIDNNGEHLDGLHVEFGTHRHGGLGYGEFRQGVRALQSQAGADDKAANLQMSDAVVRKMFQSIDETRTGEISMSDLRKWLHAYAPPSAAAAALKKSAAGGPTPSRVDHGLSGTGGGSSSSLRISASSAGSSPRAMPGSPRNSARIDAIKSTVNSMQKEKAAAAVVADVAVADVALLAEADGVAAAPAAAAPGALDDSVFDEDSSAYPAMAADDADDSVHTTAELSVEDIGAFEDLENQIEADIDDEKRSELLEMIAAEEAEAAMMSPVVATKAAESDDDDMGDLDMGDMDDLGMDDLAPGDEEELSEEELLRMIAEEEAQIAAMQSPAPPGPRGGHGLSPPPGSSQRGSPESAALAEEAALLPTTSPVLPAREEEEEPVPAATGDVHGLISCPADNWTEQLTADICVLGRAPAAGKGKSCDLVIGAAMNISRKHCHVLCFHDGAANHYAVEALGKCSLQVNELVRKAADGPVMLEDGDTLKVGSVELVFGLETGEAALPSALDDVEAPAETAEAELLTADSAATGATDLDAALDPQATIVPGTRGLAALKQSVHTAGHAAILLGSVASDAAGLSSVQGVLIDSLSAEEAGAIGPPLACLVGPDESVYQLRREATVIGRNVKNASADCRVNGDKQISRKHARLVLHESAWAVEALGKNRVFVDGQSAAGVKAAAGLVPLALPCSFRVGSVDLRINTVSAVIASQAQPAEPAEGPLRSPQGELDAIQERMMGLLVDGTDPIEMQAAVQESLPYHAQSQDIADFCQLVEVRLAEMAAEQTDLQSADAERAREKAGADERAAEQARQALGHQHALARNAAKLAEQERLAAAAAAAEPKKKGRFHFGRKSKKAAKAAAEAAALAEAETAARPARPLFETSMPELRSTHAFTPSSVPATIVAIMQGIRQTGLEEEGIFRLSVASEQLDALKGLLDEFAHDEYDEMDLDLPSHSALELACVLKRWIRELPEPRLLPNFAAMSDACDLPSLENTVVQMAQLCQDELPEENLGVLRALVDLILDVTDHAAINKMDLANMSRCITPNLTPLTYMQMPPNFDVLRVIVENHARILQPDEAVRKGTGASMVSMESLGDDLGDDFGDDMEMDENFGDEGDAEPQNFDVDMSHPLSIQQSIDQMASSSSAGAAEIIDELQQILDETLQEGAAAVRQIIAGPITDFSALEDAVERYADWPPPVQDAWKELGQVRDHVVAGAVAQLASMAKLESPLEIHARLDAKEWASGVHRIEQHEEVDAAIAAVGERTGLLTAEARAALQQATREGVTLSEVDALLAQYAGWEGVDDSRAMLVGRQGELNEEFKQACERLRSLHKATEQPREIDEALEAATARFGEDKMSEMAKTMKIRRAELLSDARKSLTALTKDPNSTMQILERVLAKYSEYEGLESSLAAMQKRFALLCKAANRDLVEATAGDDILHIDALLGKFADVAALQQNYGALKARRGELSTTMQQQLKKMATSYHTIGQEQHQDDNDVIAALEDRAAPYGDSVKEALEELERVRQSLPPMPDPSAESEGEQAALEEEQAAAGAGGADLISGTNAMLNKHMDNISREQVWIASATWRIRKLELEKQELAEKVVSLEAELLIVRNREAVRDEEGQKEQSIRREKEQRVEALTGIVRSLESTTERAELQIAQAQNAQSPSLETRSQRSGRQSPNSGGGYTHTSPAAFQRQDKVARTPAKYGEYLSPRTTKDGAFVPASLVGQVAGQRVNDGSPRKTRIISSRPKAVVVGKHANSATNHAPALGSTGADRSDRGHGGAASPTLGVVEQTRETPSSRYGQAAGRRDDGPSTADSVSPKAMPNRHGRKYPGTHAGSGFTGAHGFELPDDAAVVSIFKDNSCLHEEDRLCLTRLAVTSAVGQIAGGAEYVQHEALRAALAASLDEDGTLALPEFKMLLRYYLFFSEQWPAFEMVSESAVDGLTQSEFVAACRLVNLQIDDDEARREWRHCDPDDDGLVEFGTFCSFAAALSDLDMN